MGMVPDQSHPRSATIPTPIQRTTTTNVGTGRVEVELWRTHHHAYQDASH